MKRLNARGLNGMGGRRPQHGRAALAELLRRGIENGGDAISEIHRELTDAYVADLGGEGNISAMDRGLIKRLVAADLDLALLLAMRDRAAKMSRDKLLALSQAINRNSQTYAHLIKTLGGPTRRQGHADGEVIVRRWQEQEAKQEGDA